MTAPPTASTRVFALLGDPVSHSLSPRFQNAALAALGLDGVYLPLRCASGDLPGLLRGLARAGGGGNVTVPHKALAAGCVEAHTAAVARTGACNTFWMEGGLVHGDNTDVEGVRGAIRALLGRPPAGGSILLLGAGGAAASVLAALADEGAERVLIANRTPVRAEALAARWGGGLRVEVAATPPAGERFDLAVNATSLGLRPGDPLPPTPDADAALDLVYARGETAWVRAMRARGVPAADGREMLLLQGAAAFRRWWGVEPPLAAMRAALAEPRS